MKTVLKFPGSSKIWHGSGAFPAEIPTTAKPNHHLSPSFPRNPLSPPSDPVQRRLQSPPAKSNFLAVIGEAWGHKMEYTRREIGTPGPKWKYGIACELVTGTAPDDLIPPYNMLHYGSKMKYFSGE